MSEWDGGFLCGIIAAILGMVISEFWLGTSKHRRRNAAVALMQDGKPMKEDKSTDGFTKGKHNASE